ncbi:MAG: D-alanyl-D-alanine carboxypeptidase/D-alanyl-D-alanine-endopeptidase [Deltaproteobacteria bacterium]|nr:D-alanyl-D-alanine carboxypeptidase/D-alanyl-D-alanine-endopeptidase [Deltaproteobacteria bacterium]
MLKRLLFIILFCLQYSIIAEAQIRQLDQSVSKFLAQFKEKPALGISVINTKTGKLVYDYNGEKLLAPASTLKLLTSYATLKILGPEYQFPTEVFVDKLPLADDFTSGKKDVGKVGNLSVRGYGDPAVVHETVFDWALTLKQLGVRQIDTLQLDDTLFVNTSVPSGDNPYQAAQGALSLNHNSYGLRIVPAGQQRKAVIETFPEIPISLDNNLISINSPELPLQVKQQVSNADLFAKRADLSALKLSVIGQVKANAKSYIEYRSVFSPTQYFGSVFKSYLEKVGVSVGQVRIAAVGGRAKLLTEFKSKPLAQIISDLNHYSNNFIAGQLLYALGQKNNALFDRETGIGKLEMVMSELDISSDSYRIYDGSGLNAENKITAQALSAVLQAAYADFTVAPYFVSSLSRYGASGTLKKRSLGPGYEKDEAAIWAKTGTIDGVSSLAGYVTTRKGERIAFSVISNGISIKQLAIDFEDELLRVLIAQ